MYYLKQLLTLTVISCASFNVNAQEVLYYYDQKGNPSVWIDIKDVRGSDMPIYLLSGHSYMYTHLIAEEQFAVYTYTGKHIGWWDGKSILDNDGRIIVLTDGVKKKVSKTKYALPSKETREIHKTKLTPKNESANIDIIDYLAKYLR